MAAIRPRVALLRRPTLVALETTIVAAIRRRSDGTARENGQGQQRGKAEGFARWRLEYERLTHGSVSEWAYVERAKRAHITSLDRGFFGALCSFGKSYGPTNSVPGARPRVVDGFSPKACR
jgi:hypothetical protein